MCFSQENSLSETIISVAEELAANENDPEAGLIFTDKLNELSENPVQINSSEIKEISRLFFLSDFQVTALADYVRTSGGIISVYEIMNIPGFDKETTEMMIPFISLNVKSRDDSDYSRFRNHLLTNFSLGSGNDTGSLGSPWKILTKYKFTAGSISGGLTFEKDAGEKILNGSPVQPDFASANLVYNGKGILHRLIVGDFSARFGQGTNINTGLRSGLSVTSVGYMSSSDEIKPYTSTDENNFFRGLAADFTIKNLELFMFYSVNNSDASLGSSSGISDDIIETFYTSGYHNTPSSLQKKDTYTETVYGITASYNFEKLRMGLSWSEDRLSLPVKPPGNDPEDRFAFEGNRNDLYSLYYNYTIRRILLYGELSTDADKNLAFINGMIIKPSDRLTINALYRDYDPGYVCFHGRGPGIGSSTRNEQGILVNFVFEAARHLFISAGSDIHYFPWLKYRCSSPSWGKKQEIRIKYVPSEKIIAQFSYHHRMTMYDKQGETAIPELQETNNNTFRTSVRYAYSGNLTFTTRIDYNFVNPAGSNGILLLQDVNYKWNSIPLTMWFRYCLYNTDNWDSRIYTYENDLLYSYSIPALSSKGSRSYFMVKYEFGDMAEVRIKYGITTLSEAMNIYENRNELKLQFRIWF